MNRVSSEHVALILSPHVKVVSVFPHLSPVFFFFVQFGELGGFTAIQSKLNTDEIEIAVSVTSFLLRLCPPYNSSDVSFRVMK